MPPSQSEDTPRARPMIGAMFRGPGPAYKLPGNTGYINHDITRKKAPGWVFGTKGKSRDVSKVSPGPAHYNLLERSTRFGKDGTPKYTLHYRPKDGASFITPAPDAYYTETVKVMKQKQPPSYSFGLRTKYTKKEATPAPNAYTLPNMTGKTNPVKCSPPSFSISGRSKTGGFSEDLKQSPGPAAYKVVDVDTWRRKAPVYSMSARQFLPGDNCQKPGPGAHSPEKHIAKLNRSAPSFSFGVRHSEYLAPMIESI